MTDIIKQLRMPGYDLGKEQAIQKAIAEILRLTAEVERLQAKITEMEKQEPTHWSCEVLQADATWKEEVGREVPPSGYFCIRDIRPLYALPGAKGE